MLRPFFFKSLIVKFVSIALMAASSSMRADDVVFAVNAEPELLWNGGEFTEGVAARSDGLVFFSDIPSDPATAGRILVFSPVTGKTQVFCANSSKSNGLEFDSGDRMLACCARPHALCRARRWK